MNHADQWDKGFRQKEEQGRGSKGSEREPILVGREQQELLYIHV